MATVRIRRGEAERDLFPPICALTGVPTEAVKKKNFAWTPGWTKILILGGLLPYVVISLILTKRMVVRLPMREGKHGHWMVRQAFLLVGVLFAIQLACAGAFVGSDYNEPTIGSLMAIGGMILLLTVLIVGMVLVNRSIRPLEIDDLEMRLTGVHENFKLAFEEMRDERRRLRKARDAAALSDGAPATPIRARRYEGE